MPNLPTRLSFACRYCDQTFETSKGRSNHLSQFKSCHAQLLKASGTRTQLKRRREKSEEGDSDRLDAPSDTARPYINPTDDNSSDIMDFDPPINLGPRDQSVTQDDQAGAEVKPPVQEKSQQRKVTI